MSGASVLVAEGASQKPSDGIRTRGSQGPDDSLGHVTHMGHERGAFKVNLRGSADAVKKPSKSDASIARGGGRACLQSGILMPEF